MGIVGRASVRLLTGVRFFEQTVRSAKWALADQVIVSGFNFLTSLLLARILGIEEFGRYALAWTVVLFVQGIQYSTISSTMLSIGPKHDPPAARAYFGAIFVHQAIFGFLSTVLTWLGVNLAAPLFPGSTLDSVALPLALTVLSSQTQDFLRRYFFSVARPRISLAIDTIRYLAQNAAILAMIRWLPANSITALWLVTAAAGASALAAIPYIPRLEISLSTILTAGLRGWHFSKWLIASTLVFSAFTSLFSFAAGILLGAAAVGAMRAAFTLVSVANVVIEAGVNVITAGASRKLMDGGRRELTAYLKKVTIYGVGALLSMLAVVVIAPRFWLHFFFGPEFESYWTLVPWYAGYAILIFIGLVIGTWYRSLESTRLIFYANVFSVILSLAIAYPLIVNFGVTGAVIGLLIGQLAQVVFMAFGMKSAQPN